MGILLVTRKCHILLGGVKHRTEVGAWSEMSGGG